MPIAIEVVKGSPKIKTPNIIAKAGSMQAIIDALDASTVIKPLLYKKYGVIVEIIDKPIASNITSQLTSKA